MSDYEISKDPRARCYRLTFRKPGGGEVEIDVYRNTRSSANDACGQIVDVIGCDAIQYKQAGYPEHVPVKDRFKRCERCKMHHSPADCINR